MRTRKHRGRWVYACSRVLCVMLLVGIMAGSPLCQSWMASSSQDTATDKTDHGCCPTSSSHHDHGQPKESLCCISKAQQTPKASAWPVMTARWVTPVAL